MSVETVVASFSFLLGVPILPVQWQEFTSYGGELYGVLHKPKHCFQSQIYRGVVELHT